MLIGVILNLSLTSPNAEWRANCLVRMKKVAIPGYLSLYPNGKSLALNQVKRIRDCYGENQYFIAAENCEVEAYDVLPILI